MLSIIVHAVYIDQTSSYSMTRSTHAATSFLRHLNLKRLSQTVTTTIQRWPIVSFFGVMAVLVALVIIGNIMRRPPAAPVAKTPEPKVVAVYQLNGVPSVTVQAQVEKTGVITLIAQTPGIVQKLNVTEGQSVTRGQKVVSLSTNYQGANAASLTRQLSQRNYQHILDTLPAQQDLINKNKQLAEKNDTQAKEMRAIGRASQDETRALISLNEDIISELDEQIAALEAVNDPTVTQVKSGKAQTLGALNGLKASLRASEYTNSEDKELAAISSLTKETTLKQLELQEKALGLNKDVALLNLRLAQVSESLMYPAAPVAGVVERVHVQVGQAVNPGTVIATIMANQSTSSLEAKVAPAIATQVSHLAPSQIMLNGRSYELRPRYISNQPTNGGLYSVLFTLPDEWGAELVDGGYVTVQLPLGSGVISSGNYIPLDAIYYSQSSAYLYTVDASQQPARAHLQQVELGAVYGAMVELKTQLPADTQIILDRTVVETDPVLPQAELARTSS